MGPWNNFMDRHDFSTPTVEFFTGVKEDMNRNNMRPFVFLTHMYSLFSGCDYSKWTKEDYLEVYHPEKKGTYPKVLACFLQQSFLKRDIMPVDAWMLAFFAELLLHDKANIPTLGSELGRLERFVWATVQLRKNNQPGFDDILFCIKTGVMHSKSIHNRQPNPLSCRLCKFEESCPTRRKVVTDKTALAISPQTKLSDEEVGAIQLETLAMKSAGEEIKIHGTGTYPRPDGQGPDFIILLKDDDTPFGVYLPTNKITKDKWKLIDNMSAMTIHDPFEPGKTYSY
jgi:hypothetical protein